MPQVATQLYLIKKRLMRFSDLELNSGCSPINFFSFFFLLGFLSTSICDCTHSRKGTKLKAVIKVNNTSVNAEEAAILAADSLLLEMTFKKFACIQTLEQCW